MIGREKSIFTKIDAVFKRDKIHTEWTDTGEKALLKLTRETFDLFIIDERLPDMTGRRLVENVILKNAMMNCVVLSARSHDDFHDVYEGLGVLMQFPPDPGEEQGQALLEHLDHIARIKQRAGKPKGVAI